MQAAPTAAERRPGSGAGAGLLRAAGTTVLALFVVLMASSPPEAPRSADVTADSARRFFVENAAHLEVVALLSTIASALLVLTAALLRRLVVTALPGTVLGDVVLASGCLLAVYSWLFGAVFGVGDAEDPEAVDPAIALAWLGLLPLAEHLGDSVHVLRGLFVGAVALAAHRARWLPRWLSVLGLVAAAACLIGEIGGSTDWGGFVAVWFVGLVGFLLWLLLLGATLVLRSRRAPSTVARA